MAMPPAAAVYPAGVGGGGGGGGDAEKQENQKYIEAVREPPTKYSYGQASRQKP